MKIIYKLNVSKQDFYNYLIHSLLLEINYNSIKPYSIENIHPGFTYQKTIKDKSGNEIKTNIEIIEINNNIIKTKLESPSTTHIMTYHFKDNNLIYEEEVKSNKKTLEYNHKFMSFILKFKLKKQIIKKFKNIEIYIEGNI